MADTQRTASAILALCADNTSGAIGAQDLRDGWKSVVFRDGTQGFTAVVSGVTPTAAAHLATKAYVDERTGGAQAEFGSLYFSTPAATTLDTDTWTKAAGTTTIGPSVNFTMPVNNRLRHDDDETETYDVQFSGSVTCGGNIQVVWLGLSKNGATPEQGSWRPRKIGTGSDVGAVECAWYFELAPADYVELWVKNETSSATVTIEQGSLLAKKLT